MTSRHSPGFAHAYAVGLRGIEGHIVEVQAHLAQGLPSFVITGLGDTAVGQARDRVRSALQNAGYSWPSQRITVGLCPAWLPKRGSAFDAAVAAAILSAQRLVPRENVESTVCLGELGLDGSLRPICGVLPSVLAAQRAGFTAVIVPGQHLSEARLVPGVSVSGAENLHDIVAILRGNEVEVHASWERAGELSESPLCLSEVVGQPLGRKAIEVAAAGSHNVAMFGPPGAGKTLLAERIPGILPALSEEEALEVTALHSLAGGSSEIAGLITIPPYQAPHHNATVASLVGGGSSFVTPGVVSLAHRGVLFLDEATEFGPRVADALRQPLERGEITIARASGVTRFPAKVQLVLAANPCPCGAGRAVECECSPSVRRRYLARLSGPLLDRVDIQVELPPVTPSALYEDADSEPSEVVAVRVRAAREAARERWKRWGWSVNAQASGVVLRSEFRLQRKVTGDLDRALDRGILTARGYDRVLRLAWTLADLAGHVSPHSDDVATATSMRTRRGK